MLAAAKTGGFAGDHFALTQPQRVRIVLYACAFGCPLNFFARVRKSSTRPEPISRANSSGSTRGGGKLAGLPSGRRLPSSDNRRFSIFMFLSLGDESLRD